MKTTGENLPIRTTRRTFTHDMKPLILISNDDGYQARGINCLIDMLRPIARLLVVAPDGPRSGMSCACTFTQPLYKNLIREEQDVTVWSCTGTPVDCIKLAFDNICSEKPAMVIGGINHGDNSAVNAHYSGTMGIAFEGCMKGIPSVAFSIDNHAPDADFTPWSDTVRSIVSFVLNGGLPPYTCLNVNFPNASISKGIRICRMAYGDWKNEFDKYIHPRSGNDYFWLTGNFQLEETNNEDTDRKALMEGYTAITPIRLDLTDYDLKQRLEKEFMHNNTAQ